MYGKQNRGTKVLRRGLVSDRCSNLSVAKISEIIYQPNDNRPYAPVEVFGKPMIGLLDSGASISILGKGCYDLAKQLQLSLLIFDQCYLQLTVQFMIFHTVPTCPILLMERQKWFLQFCQKP